MKSRIMPLHLSVMVVALGLVLSGCETTVAITGRFPARYSAVGQVRKIEVRPFEGAEGPDFSAAIEAMLAAAQFDGAPYFQITTGEDGRAEAVLGGQVATSIHTDEFTSSSIECAAYEGKKCVRTQAVTIPCARRTAVMTVIPKLTRRADGQLLYSQQRSGMRNVSWCAGQTQPESDEVLLGAARNTILVEIRKDIAPYNQSINATLKTSADGLSKDLAEKFNLAVKAANAQNFIGACKLWEEVHAAAANHAATLYDLGVCAEASGQYSQAVNIYGQVLSYSPADQEAVQAMNRAKRLQEASGTVNNQQQERQRVAAEQDRSAAAKARAQRTADDAVHAEAQHRIRAVEQAEQATVASRKAAAATRRNAVVSKYGALAADAILAGEVKIGMSSDQVRAAKGPPQKVEKMGGGEELWRYGTQRVMMTKGKVIYVSK